MSRTTVHVDPICQSALSILCHHPRPASLPLCSIPTSAPFLCIFPSHRYSPCLLSSGLKPLSKQHLFSLWLYTFLKCPRKFLPWQHEATKGLLAGPFSPSQSSLQPGAQYSLGLGEEGVQCGEGKRTTLWLPGRLFCREVLGRHLGGRV